MKLISHEKMDIGHGVAMFQGLITWWGPLTKLRDAGVAIDVLHVHPDDRAKLVAPPKREDPMRRPPTKNMNIGASW